MNSSPGCIRACMVRNSAAWPEATASAAVPPSRAAIRSLQHRVRRIGDAGVDVAERLEAEQRGGVIDVVEHEAGRLVDRRGPRARSRIGGGPRMDREGVEAGNPVGHRALKLRERMAFASTPAGPRAQGAPDATLALSVTRSSLTVLGAVCRGIAFHGADGSEAADRYPRSPRQSKRQTVWR